MSFYRCLPFFKRLEWIQYCISWCLGSRCWTVMFKIYICKHIYIHIYIYIVIYIFIICLKRFSKIWFASTFTNVLRRKSITKSNARFGSFIHKLSDAVGFNTYHIMGTANGLAATMQDALFLKASCGNMVRLGAGLGGGVYTSYRNEFCNIPFWPTSYRIVYSRQPIFRITES